MNKIKYFSRIILGLAIYSCSDNATKYNASLEGFKKFRESTKKPGKVRSGYKLDIRDSDKKVKDVIT